MHQGTIAGVPRLLFEELSSKYGTQNETRLELHGNKYLVRGLPSLGLGSGLACIVLSEQADSFDLVGITALLPTYAKTGQDVAHLTNHAAYSYVEARHGIKPKHELDRYLRTERLVGFGNSRGASVDTPLWSLTRVLFDRAAELFVPFPKQIPLRQKVA